MIYDLAQPCLVLLFKLSLLQASRIIVWKREAAREQSQVWITAPFLPAGNFSSGHAKMHLCPAEVSCSLQQTLLVHHAALLTGHPQNVLGSILAGF